VGVADARVHGEKTREWAQEVGFSRAGAEAIARADLGVDREGLPRNQYHMRPRLLLGRDRRRSVALGHLRAAREAAGRGDCEEAWEHLGRGLHALQDQSAHGGWWWLGVHWFPWFDDLERTMWGRRDARQRRLGAVARVTKSYLREALSDPSVQHCVEARGAAGE
jgi:hypothetical protein